MDKPKPKNDKHIELSDDDLKKVAGGKKAIKQPDPPPEGVPSQTTEGGGA